MVKISELNVLSEPAPNDELLIRDVSEALEAAQSKRVKLTNLSVGPVGAVIQYAGTSAPNGWLLCQGQAVSRAIYEELFAAIGTIYGAGDGSTTFNLPDLRGKVPVGLDLADSKFDALGNMGGEKSHVLSVDEMPTHTHIQNSHGHTIKYTSTKAGSGATIASVNGELTASDVVNNATATNKNTGGGKAHNNLQPYMILNYIIKI